MAALQTARRGAPSGPTERAPERAGARRGRRLALIGAIAAGAALAAALAGFNLSQPHALFGISEYDDGVYLASALRLLAGKAPYRDFVFVQPPGITLVLAPFALVAHLVGSRAALGWARIATCAVAAGNAALCGVLVRYRGVLAALVAACALGAFPPAILATHTVLLEPYLTFFCLVGLNLVFSRGELTSGWRLALGGVALGVATSVKLWGLLVVGVVVLCALSRPRRALLVAGGATAGAAAICAPFFALAPGAFVHEVVTAQLLRHARKHVPIVSRLFDLSGLQGLDLKVTPPNSAPAGIIIVALVAFLVLAAVLLPALVRRRPLLECCAALAAAVVSAALFVPREFYVHYVYFPAALDAVAVGLAAGAIAAAARSAVARLPRRPRHLLGGTLAAAAGVVALGALGGALAAETSYIAQRLPASDPAASIERLVPAGACTLTDTEVELVVADRVSERPGCPTIVDSTGTWLTYAPTVEVGGRSDRGGRGTLVRRWRSWLGRARYLVLTNAHAFRIPWTVGLHRYVDTHFRLLGGHGALVYVRRRVPLPVAALPPRLRRASAA